jgi:hypothetical protein
MTETSVATVPELPDHEEAGSMGEWPLPVSDTGEVLTVTGRFLGVGSSARSAHAPHLGEFAEAGERCRACRWFEARIFRFGENADGDFVVYNVGQSVVPGETPRYTVRRVASAEEVVDLLTRRSDGGVGGSSTVSLPAEIVLSTAAQHDRDIHEAYVNRRLA